MEKIGEVVITDAMLQEHQTITQTLDDVYKTGKAGHYTITKVAGLNNHTIPVGHIAYGWSRGIVVGCALLLDTPSRWFRTSSVISVVWESDSTGVIETLNSTYKFTYKADNND